MEGPLFVDVDEETGSEDFPSTEMVTEVVRSPSMCVKVRTTRLLKKKKL